MAHLRRPAKWLLLGGLAAGLLLPSVSNADAAAQTAAIRYPAAVVVDGAVLPLRTDPILASGGHLLLPLRDLFESLQAEVFWTESSKQIRIVRGDMTIVLHIGSDIATKNGEHTAMDQPPMLSGGTSYVPLRFVGEALGGEVNWNEDHRLALVATQPDAAGTVPIPIPSFARLDEWSAQAEKLWEARHPYRFEPWSEQRTVRVGSRAISVTLVHLPEQMKPRVGLADGKVGRTQELSGIAASYHAAAAMNGTFFSAYSDPHDPDFTLIDQGRLLYVGNTGSAVGFTSNGDVLMDRLRVKIVGSTDGSAQWPHNWYAYFVNRTPSPDGDSAVMFTPGHGSETGFAYGTSVTVEDGVVTGIAAGRSVAIPSDGYVLVFTGSESYLADRFKIGTRAGYRVAYTDEAGHALDWSGVATAFGSGPLLLKDGRIVLNAAAEGFTSAKILSESGARSAFAVQNDGSYLLAAAKGATMADWAAALRQLGCRDAINMDGGASSGLWLDGKTIVKPGRALSNAMIFVKPTGS